MTRTSIDRRTLLRCSAVTGAALAAGVAMPAIAQTKPIKLGYVEPADRAACGFRRSRQLHHRAASRTRPKAASRSATRRHRSRSWSRTASPTRTAPREVAKDLIVQRQGRPHARSRVDARDDESGLDPMRDRGSAVHLDTSRPGSPGSSAARPIRRRPAGLEAVQLHLSFLLGARGRHRGLHQHVEPASRPTNRSAACFRTTATAMPGATSRSASRRCSRSSATSSPIPGRYQNLTDNFSAQINAFKKCQLRDRHRRGAAARLHDLLEAGAAARLQAEGRIDRQGDPVPGRRSRHWDATATTCHRRSGGRRTIPFKSSLTGHEREAISRPPTRPRPRSNGRSRSASCMRCSRSRSTCSSARRNAATPRRPCKAIADDQPRHGGRHIWHGMARTLPPFAAEERRENAAGRRPMAAQGRQQVRHRDHRQSHRAGSFRPPARWSRLRDSNGNATQRSVRHGRASSRPSTSCRGSNARMPGTRPGMMQPIGLKSISCSSTSKACAKSFRFGGRCADKLDLAVAPGEALGIIGPNGAGKDDAIQSDCRQSRSRSRRNPFQQSRRHRDQSTSTLQSWELDAPIKSRSRSRASRSSKTCWSVPCTGAGLPSARRGAVRGHSGAQRA